MIRISVSKIEIPLQNVWYHKKNNIKDFKLYTIELDTSFSIITDFLISYVGAYINLTELVVKLKEKEDSAGSLGIIWHLIQFFDKLNLSEILEDKTKSYYILNTVDEIYFKDRFVLIKGKSSA